MVHIRHIVHRVRYGDPPFFLLLLLCSAHGTGFSLLPPLLLLIACQRHAAEDETGMGRAPPPTPTGHRYSLPSREKQIGHRVSLSLSLSSFLLYFPFVVHVSISLLEAFRVKRKTFFFFLLFIIACRETCTAAAAATVTALHP